MIQNFTLEAEASSLPKFVRYFPKKSEKGFLNTYLGKLEAFLV